MATINRMSYVDESRNGLQDEPRKKRKYESPLYSHKSEEHSSHKFKEKHLPNVLLCFRKAKTSYSRSGIDKRGKSSHEESRNKKFKKRSKSRELRGGILYVGCDCEKRNGLQDDCPRSECQGSPECLTIPPTCGPSEFSNGKHLAKKIEKVRREREAYAKRLKAKEHSGQGEHHEKGEHHDKDNTDYDCIPLDDMLQDGQPCPICNKPLDKISTHENVAEQPCIIHCGPFVMTFPIECLCPSAL